MASTQQGGKSPATGLVVTAAIASTVVALVGGSQLYRLWIAREKHESRFHWVKAEIDAQNAAAAKTAESEEGEEGGEHEVLPSIIAHFSDFQLDYGATVEEANKKRVSWNLVVSCHFQYFVCCHLDLENFFRFLCSHYVK